MLYKYLPPERLDVIENLSIRFSPLRSLNDPFESMPLIGIDSEIREVLADARTEIEQMWDAEVEKTDEKRAEFEDATEQLSHRAEKISKPALVGRRFVDQLTDNFGVLSLSRTNTSLLMWAHYTVNGEGYVLAFDETHQFFNEQDAAGRPTRPFPVVYSSQRKIVGAKDQSHYENLLCRKSIDWAYEEEERVFRVFSPSSVAIGTDGFGQKVVLSELPSDSVSAVYIGYNASQAIRGRLLSAAESRLAHCSIYNSRIAEDEYRVLFEPIAPKE